MRFTGSPGYLKDVLVTLVKRELSIRYKGSWLGLLWAILSPLGTVIVLSFLFTTILPLNIPHFVPFMYSAMLLWSWFQASVQTSASTLIDNRDLVRKPFFPRPLLPAVVTGSNFLLYLLAFPVLLALMLLDGMSFSWTLLLLPLVWLVQILFTLACSIFFSALGVVIRDVQHLLGVIMLLWFYITPIFYDIKQVPANVQNWLMLNPLTTLVQAHRAVTLYGQMPDWGALGMVSLVGAGLLVASLALFRGLENAFVEEV